jgi:NAD(P)-dependent dehydrogenase (short-subunit alcohol dehydrogenase family)
MKNYIIIGASTGVGRQLALNLAGAGAQVFGTFHQHEPNDEVQNLKYAPLDVLAEQYDLSFAPITIDGIVYCPGSINLKPFARISPDQFVNDYKLQVIGAVRVIQSLMPQLKLSEHPSIVLFSTVAVQSGFTYHSQVSASKGAIEGLTKALAAEFAPKIRVNAIAPSLTDTPLAATLLSSPEKREANAMRNPLKKIGTPTDIANLAQFLLSDQSTWITGQIYHIDGGMSTLKL